MILHILHEIPRSVYILLGLLGIWGGVGIAIGGLRDGGRRR